MSDFKKGLRAGLFVGAAAGAAWLISRYLAREEAKLIDWGYVRRLAVATCRQTMVGLPFSKRVLAEQYAELVRLAEQPIAAYTGKYLPQPLSQIYVFDRIDWIDANIANFELLFAPFEKMHQEALRTAGTSSRVVGELNKIVISGQLGLLLGYLAQRVLGQYDLSLFGREPITSGRLYFVEPNIIELQHRLAIDRQQLRMWIVLHETTHAYEFEACPWLRNFLNSLLTQYFETISKDFRRGRGDALGLRTLVERVATNLFSSRNILELVMTTEQRRIFNQLQALMCLLEGYSNHIMQAIGASILPSYNDLKQRFDDRARHKSTAERLFAKLTGLDIKLEQYALGERFVNEVVEKRGIAFVNRVWESPANLPTLVEVRAPEKWIGRMEKAAA